MDGIVGIVPNEVFFESSVPVRYGDREYAGFYLSYNSRDTSIYGCVTTAIVLGQGQKFLILDGDHRDRLSETVSDGGLEACVSYFVSHMQQMNRLSERP